MKHIDDATGLTLCSKADFYSAMRQGQLMFCAGEYDTSKVIQRVTDSPWSHVLYVWSEVGRWLTLEATDNRGVHVGLMTDYVDKYDGVLCLCDVGYSIVDTVKVLSQGLSALGDGYNFGEEVQIAANRVFYCIRVTPSKTEYYCSGLQAFMSQASSHPFFVSTKRDATPEDLWVEEQTKAICYYRPGGA